MVEDSLQSQLCIIVVGKQLAFFYDVDSDRMSYFELKDMFDDLGYTYLYD